MVHVASHWVEGVSEQRIVQLCDPRRLQITHPHDEHIVRKDECAPRRRRSVARKERRAGARGGSSRHAVKKEVEERHCGRCVDHERQRGDGATHHEYHGCHAYHESVAHHERAPPRQLNETELAHERQRALALVTRNGCKQDKARQTKDNVHEGGAGEIHRVEVVVQGFDARVAPQVQAHACVRRVELPAQDRLLHCVLSGESVAWEGVVGALSQWIQTPECHITACRLIVPDLEGDVLWEARAAHVLDLALLRARAIHEGDGRPGAATVCAYPRVHTLRTLKAEHAGCVHAARVWFWPREFPVADLVEGPVVGLANVLHQADHGSVGRRGKCERRAPGTLYWRIRPAFKVGARHPPLLAA
mmetsp:Transcript_16469/g.50536  ORF Transcript_16469/g.50536 Transcript_16469/m.50536 type:complete len:361 (+) Transcript_16469:1466-2548(+)